MDIQCRNYSGTFVGLCIGEDPTTPTENRLGAVIHHLVQSGASIIWN